ncbi:DUF624 domain-containing protein [Aquibacillus kalidii]|uniref:DUF624 domain-containing protein n=1 Tax=Aquibacillus kalidii TaxID=2762597 RepID=UPI001645036D|nr:DUF624 domain-containing protein [Aquibacillus kalidii]
MNKKIYTFFQVVYKFIVVSFYFWISLIKGLIIYSIIPSIAALYLTIDSILKGKKEDADLKVTFNEYNDTYNQYKLSSFIFSLVMIMSIASLLLLLKVENRLAVIGIIVAVYILFMTFVTLSYTVNYLVYRNLSIKHSFAFAFVSVLKFPVQTLLVTSLFIILLAAAYLNIVFFVAFGPIIYSFGIRIAIKKLIETD